MDNRTIEEIRKNETLLIEEIKGLIEENQELKKQLEVGKEQYNDLVEEKEKIQEQLSSNTLQFENQQKEFIEYLKSEIKNSDICDVYVHGMKFNSAEKMIYKDILSKYKEIIGGSNANISRR